MNIQSKTKELDVSSCSASYLRQLLRKTEKQSATTQESTKGTDAVATEQVTEPVITEGKSDTKATPTEGSSTVEPSTLKLAEDSAEGIASAVIGLAKAKNISLAEIATLLLASAE
jgi:hypothetical protein